MKQFRLGADALVMVSASSAGTQPKYYENGYWYKTDRNGYEGKAEYLCSMVLSCSNVKEYVTYEPCMINGRQGCRAKSFLKPSETFISFQRLYDMYEGGSLSERIMPMNRVEDRIGFVLSFIAEYAQADCASYLSDILSLDMLTLNTDRHFHNLGIITDAESGKSRPAPVFDNADALLASYAKFDPEEPFEKLIEEVYAQPFSANHEIQAQAAGITLRIDYDRLNSLFEQEPDSRALQVLRCQLARYHDCLQM